MERMSWGNLIWLNDVSPTKILVLWKLLYDRLPIDLEIKKKSGFMFDVFSVWK